MAFSQVHLTSASSSKGYGYNLALSNSAGLAWAISSTSQTTTVTLYANAAAIPGGAALTRTNDTNVTLTLGGTPTTALLQATSLTLGWSGQLAVSRGGTGNSSLGALTKTDDTNVTLTLGGSPTTALVNAASLTLGWTGQLSVARGGTGAGSFTSTYVLYGNGTSAIQAASGLRTDGTTVAIGGVAPDTPKLLVVSNTTALATAVTGTLLRLAAADSTVTRIQMNSFATSAGMTFFRANTGAGSPSALAADDSMAFLNAGGYHSGGAYSSAQGQFELRAHGAWTNTSRPTYWLIYTTPSGSTTQTVAGQVSEAGNWGLGSVFASASATPGSKLVVTASTTAPQAATSGTVIHASNANGTVTRVLADGYAAHGSFIGRRSNNTAASPSALAADDALADFAGAGYGTSHTTPRASLAFYSSQVWNGTNNGTYQLFWTTPDNSTTPTVRGQIAQNGFWGIGTGFTNAANAPGAQLSVVSPAVSGGDETVAVACGAHTSVTAEVIDVTFDLARTVTITGDYALQRGFVVTAPTYSASSTKTITEAETMHLWAPTDASSAVITNRYALKVGASFTFGSNTNSYNYGAIYVPAHTVTLKASGTNNAFDAYACRLGILAISKNGSTFPAAGTPNFSTLQIDGAPTLEGTTNGWAIYVKGGPSNFSGSTIFNGAQAAISTTITSSTVLPHMGTCAGAPSGAPTTYTGNAPFIYDSTNHRIYVYSGSWRSVAVT